MNKFFYLFLLLCLFLSGCNRLKRDVIHSTSPNKFVPSYKNYEGEYKEFILKDISIQLPVDFEIQSDSTDGLAHSIYASSKKSLYLLHINTVPVEVNPKYAADYLQPLTTLRGSQQVDSFIEGAARGVHEDVNDGDGVFNGESFCFTKKSFTFYILSYGKKSDYFSSFCIVKRIEPLVKPLSAQKKKQIADNMKPHFEQLCLSFIKGRINKDPILKDVFNCTKIYVDLENVHIKCTLTGDYSQLYPGQKSILRGILIDARSLKPYNSEYALLGYNFSIGFYKPSGENIKLNDD